MIGPMTIPVSTTYIIIYCYIWNNLLIFQNEHKIYIKIQNIYKI